MNPIDYLRARISEIETEIIRAYDLKSGSKSNTIDNQFKADQTAEVAKLKELKQDYEFAVQNLIEI